MKKILVLTGSELRHSFFRVAMASTEGIDVLASYCEGRENTVHAIVEKDAVSALRQKHLAARRQSEEDFFRLFVERMSDRSHAKHIPRGDINTPAITDAIRASGADLLVAYGCSMIKEPLLTAFKGRFLNVHLGLSPYYRGSGTNFWALVNNEPECVGATFMHIDAGVDTGEIIHQIRARVQWGDTSHQIGNRLIVDMARTYGQIVAHFDRMQPRAPLSTSPTDKVYKRKDFSEDAVKLLYQRFADGLVENYMADMANRVSRYPLVSQPAL